MAKKNEGSITLINWVNEAEAVIADVKCHVAEIKISETLENTPSSIYFNIRTFEGNVYCVNLSANGFRIEGNACDTLNVPRINANKINADDDCAEVEFFETPYALLDKISKGYVESFGNQICKELMQLKQMSSELKEEDKDFISYEKNGETFHK